MFKLTLFILLSNLIFASQTLKPLKEVTVSGIISDIVITPKELYISTNSGTVETYNIKTGKQKQLLKLPQILDFTKELMDAEIASIDVIDNKLLVVGMGKHGFKNVFIYEDGKKTQIFKDTQSLFIKKAKFIDPEHILVGLFGNEIFLYNLKTKKRVYTKQINHSMFSDFVLSEDKKTFVSCDESGVLHLMQVKDGVIYKEYNNHVDNVYMVDLVQNILIGAGQDRKLSIVNTDDNSQTTIVHDFFIYSAKIDSKAKRIAYSFNEQSDVKVIDIASKKEEYILPTHTGTMQTILFLSDTMILTASQEEKFFLWRLP